MTDITAFVSPIVLEDFRSAREELIDAIATANDFVQQLIEQLSNARDHADEYLSEHEGDEDYEDACENLAEWVDELTGIIDDLDCLDLPGNTESALREFDPTAYI